MLKLSSSPQQVISTSITITSTYYRNWWRFLCSASITWLRKRCSNEFNFQVKASSSSILYFCNDLKCLDAHGKAAAKSILHTALIPAYTTPESRYALIRDSINNLWLRFLKVFHEGLKSWSCCADVNKPVLEFEAFMKILVRGLLIITMKCNNIKLGMYRVGRSYRGSARSKSAKTFTCGRFDGVELGIQQGSLYIIYATYNHSLYSFACACSHYRRGGRHKCPREAGFAMPPERV